MRTADAIVNLLIANGVEVVFGVPGDTSMSFHDAFAKHMGQIRHITCRDERHAAYMADTYARVSGKPGIVEVPSGGGALYAVPGVSEANESSIPLICFSSDISMNSEETGALTGLKQEYLYQPITKWNAKIKQASQMPHLIRKAFRMAVGGRPGAVHLSIPENIHEHEQDFSLEDLAGSAIIKEQAPFKNEPSNLDIEKIAPLLMKASRPVIIAGGGVHLSAAYKELECFSKLFNIPVATSINGKGSISEFSPLSVGVIGVNGGSEETNKVIKNSDFVLVLGSKLNNVTTMGRDIFSSSPKIVQVDISEEMLDVNVRVDAAVMCDIKSFLLKLSTVIEGKREDLVPRFEKWNSFVQSVIKSKYVRVSQEVEEETQLVNPAKIIDFLGGLTDEETIFVVDAGTQTPFMAANFRIKKAGRKTIFDRGHGNLGYALPASIGAKIARPDAKVISLFGDGSFAMSVGELETAKRLQLPITFINFQNNSFGWIKKIQQLYFDERYIAVDFEAINAVKIAEGFGLKAMQITSNDTLEEALKWALNANEPVLLDIIIDPPTDVIPPVLSWQNDSKLSADERKQLTY